MITVITLKRKKELEENERKYLQVSLRLSEAHRWLNDYDWLLKPFWEYIFENKTYASDMRKYMNDFYADFKTKLQIESVNDYLKSMENALSEVVPENQKKSAKKIVKKKRGAVKK